MQWTSGKSNKICKLKTLRMTQKEKKITIKKEAEGLKAGQKEEERTREWWIVMSFMEKKKRWVTRKNTKESFQENRSQSPVTRKETNIIKNKLSTATKPITSLLLAPATRRKLISKCQMKKDPLSSTTLLSKDKVRLTRMDLETYSKNLLKIFQETLLYRMRISRNSSNYISSKRKVTCTTTRIC